MTTVYREEISKAEFFENAHEGIAAIIAVNGNSSELIEVRMNGDIYKVSFITSHENGETVNKVETMSESEIVELLGDFFYHEENEIGLVFFIHLCKDLNKIARYFSREEICQCSLDYYSAYKHNKTEDIDILLNEISVYHELDYYTNKLKNI